MMIMPSCTLCQSKKKFLKVFFHLKVSNLINTPPHSSFTGSNISSKFNSSVKNLLSVTSQTHFTVSFEVLLHTQRYYRDNLLQEHTQRDTHSPHYSAVQQHWELQRLSEETTTFAVLLLNHKIVVVIVKLCLLRMHRQQRAAAHRVTRPPLIIPSAEPLTCSVVDKALFCR